MANSSTLIAPTGTDAVAPAASPACMAACDLSKPRPIPTSSRPLTAGPNCPVLGMSGKCGPALNMPVGISCPVLPLARKLGLENTPCGHCYTQNSYKCYKAAYPAHMRNLERWIEDPTEFWDRFIRDVGHKEYVRLFAFGDIPHPDFGVQLAAACTECPRTRFWLSTKCVYVPRFEPALRELAATDNITVRASGILIGADVRAEIGRSLLPIDGMTYAAVVKPDRLNTWRDRGTVCPGVTNKTTCAKAGCRDCWSQNCEMVVYPLH